MMIFIFTLIIMIIVLIMMISGIMIMVITKWIIVLAAIMAPLISTSYWGGIQKSTRLFEEMEFLMAVNLQ